MPQLRKLSEVDPRGRVSSLPGLSTHPTWVQGIYILYLTTYMIQGIHVLYIITWSVECTLYSTYVPTYYLRNDIVFFLCTQAPFPRALGPIISSLELYHPQRSLEDALWHEKWTRLSSNSPALAGGCDRSNSLEFLLIHPQRLLEDGEWYEGMSSLELLHPQRLLEDGTGGEGPLAWVVVTPPALAGGGVKERRLWVALPFI